MFNFFKINKRKKVDEDILRLQNKVNRMLIESKIFNKRITADISQGNLMVIYSLYSLIENIQGTSDISVIDKMVSDFMDEYDHFDVTIADLKTRLDVHEDDETFESAIHFTVMSLERLLSLYKYLTVISKARQAIVDSNLENQSGDLIVNRVLENLLATVTMIIHDLEYYYSLFFDKELSSKDTEYIERLKNHTKNIDEFILNCYFNNTFLNVHGMDSKTVCYEALQFDEYSVKFTYMSSDENVYDQIFVYPKRKNLEARDGAEVSLGKLSAILIISKYTEITKNEE